MNRDPNDYDLICDMSIDGTDLVDSLRGENFGIYVTPTVVWRMPKAKSESGKINFFRIDQSTRNREAEKIANSIGLTLVDPYSLIFFYKANPDFYLNRVGIRTEWVDPDSVSCMAYIGPIYQRQVGLEIRQDHKGWSTHSWFAGFKI